MIKKHISLEAVNSSSSQPLYLQIKTVIAQQIQEGGYLPHERLPSESELIKVFGVSRITVRQALRDLHGEGLVFSVQGKGTFVSQPKAIQNVQRLQGFGEAMVPQGYEITTSVISVQEARPPQEVAEALEIKQSDLVIELKRVRNLNGEPISIDHSFYPLEIGQPLMGKDLSQDIFPMMENEFKIALSYADLRIQATLADTDEVRYLNYPAESPVLKIRRLVFTEPSQPVAIEILSYRGDAFQYHLRAER